MKKNLVLILFLSLFYLSRLSSQQLIDYEDIYLENNLAYKYNDEKLFSGIAQIKKKNGQISYELEYDKGVILSQKIYARKKDKGLLREIIYDPQKPYKELKQLRYFSDVEETKYFDDKGKRKLIEQRRNGLLFYSCEYLNGKKNGRQICFNDDGTKTIVEFSNGKKLTNDNKGYN
ncbi:hypothetical protein [Cellulophaga lytica]|uniref:MORN variant repeat-containing protein n=1 Tax=Cellulophaga lytica (strain ATCC 23178 / DSM 7489 / JCM 8516 / NBRC 14961 / NCIMB 1423 / VKM B-1433 / Cy l20) TaxID=867900 RepID=F0RIH7_CELLC|nr:hypothetical protein [Cellulophaga lytica]ADY29306.1 hypothetical protein Celly_1481 [Cellulophaga lytica DSM 7489]MDO6853527.1 hypothetical protein [Cellulophaga lytica]WQG76519.1 hypothetical protein SR888_12580 [Cellulophaga lytica]SNQ42428.1 conserved exported hypothetical protein [Cellulophaga lytica]